MSRIVKRAPETSSGDGGDERRREEDGGVEAQSQKIALRAQ